MPSAFKLHPESEKISQGSHEQQTKKSFLSPFILFAILIALGWGLWSQWPVILMTSIRWQKMMINQLSELLYTARQEPGSMKLLLEISFLYGIFHSLGPGHGKVVVSTYLATHQTKIRAGIIIPVVAALVQALTAIILVSVFLYLFHATMHQLNASVQYFFRASALGVVLIGFYIIVRAVVAGAKQQAHTHTAQCSCGHHHVASADALNHASSLKEYLALIFSIGIRPCTGALLVLFFSHLANVYWLGVLSSILMGAGTALTTTGIALCAVSGKKIVRFYASYSSSSKSRYMSIVLKIVAGCVVVLFGLLLFNQGSFGMSPVFGR